MSSLPQGLIPRNLVTEREHSSLTKATREDRIREHFRKAPWEQNRILGGPKR
jgi:hypothetical protein